MIRLAFFSNYLNEHVLPLCQAFDDMDDVEFTFIALSHGGNAGRNDLNDSYSFVVREYEGPEGVDEAMQHALDDEVVIFGDMCDNERYVQARLNKGLLSFRATERLLKRGLGWRFFLPKVNRVRRQFLQYRDKPLYALCVSAYTSYDLSLFGWPVERCFKWGYFPQMDIMDDVRHLHGEIASIVWAGRLIRWKRPFKPLQLARRLKRDGRKFHLTLAGDGPLMEKLKRYVRKYDLLDDVNLTGMLSGRDTKALMSNADIYLTTSSRKEGWGATVNESMAAGCAVVASASIGSAPFLIEDGLNGLLYDDLDLSGDDLTKKVEWLIDNPEHASILGTHSKESLNREWAAGVAAGRLVGLAQSLGNHGCGLPINSGPCSQAQLIKDGWYHNL